MTHDEIRLLVETVLFETGRPQFDADIYAVPEAFGDFLIACIAKMLPETRFERIDALRVRIALPDGEQYDANFARLMDGMSTDNLSRNRAVIEDHLVNLRGTIDQLSDRSAFHDPARLVPLILLKPKPPQPEVEDEGQPPGSSKHVGWHFSGPLDAAVAVDTGNSFHYVMQSHLSELGATADELGERAMANLRDAVAAQRGGGLLASDYDEPIVQFTGLHGFTSSILLLEEFWQAEAAKAGGALFMHAVTKNDVVAMRMDDLQTVSMIINRSMSGSLPSAFPGSWFVFDGSVRAIGPEAFRVVAVPAEDASENEGETAPPGDPRPH
jgi:hypothetical protein